MNSSAMFENPSRELMFSRGHGTAVDGGDGVPRGHREASADAEPA